MPTLPSVLRVMVTQRKVFGPRELSLLSVRVRTAAMSAVGAYIGGSSTDDGSLGGTGGFPVWGLMPRRETGVVSFQRAQPAADGRGTLLAVLDSGIDPAVRGLQVLHLSIQSVCIRSLSIVLIDDFRNNSIRNDSIPI